ncbi:MAG: hypothetical protein Q8M08_11800 [Bacteroidales bacterium]|nr:hypothetical protein [Bacteroidales bacterium]
MKMSLKLSIFKKVLVLLFHPLALSLLLTLIILVIFPVNIPKYRLIVAESARNQGQIVDVWEDLKNDGISDRIVLRNYEIGCAAVGVYFHPSGRNKEWQIPGKLLSQANNNFFVIGELSAGKNKEIFVFTKSHDSLFLNRISDWTSQEKSREQTFISTFGIVNGNDDANIVSPRLEDMDNDSVKELIFGINTGLSVTECRCTVSVKPAGSNL